MADSNRPTPDGRTPVQPVTPTGPPPTPDERAAGGEPAEATPRPARPRRGRRLVPADHERRAAFTPEQRLLILDAWQRSGLPAADFAPLVGLSRHTLYAWKQRFEQHGPAGLLDQPLGAPAGSRLPELTRRTILLLKQAHPDWGCQKLSDMLLRGPALPACPSAVARVLREAGYTTEDNPAPRPARAARPSLRARQTQPAVANGSVYLHSAPSESKGVPGRLHGRSQPLHHVLRPARQRVQRSRDRNTSGGATPVRSKKLARLLECGDSSPLLGARKAAINRRTPKGRPPPVPFLLRTCLDLFGTPQEVLTDRGPQYATWRGTSAFAKERQRRGIKQVVASPRHPPVPRPRQLSATAPGDRWPRAGGSLLRGGIGGAAGPGGASGGQCAGTGVRGSAASAVLRGGAGGRTGFQPPCRGTACLPDRAAWRVAACVLEVLARLRSVAAGGRGYGPRVDDLSHRVAAAVRFGPLRVSQGKRLQ